MSKFKEFQPVKLETAANFRRKMQLMLVAAIPLIYVVFTTMLLINDDHGSFARLMIRFYWLGVLVLAAIAAYGIYLHQFKRSVFSIRESFPGQLYLSISGVDGRVTEAHGTWTVFAQYQKIPFKLGTYQKDLWLTLLCDGKPFVTLFYRTPAAASAPEGFMLTETPERFGVPVFVTPKTELIYQYLISA